MKIEWKDTPQPLNMIERLKFLMDKCHFDIRTKLKSNS